MDEETRTSIFYYAKRQRFGQIITLCASKSDPFSQFWRAACLLPAQALRELQLLSKGPLELAAPLAMLKLHRDCNPVDQEAIEELEARLDIALAARPSELALSMAISYLCVYPVADPKSYLEKLGSTTLTYLVYSAILEQNTSKSLELFDVALQRYPKSLDALMGKLLIIRSIKKDQASDIASQIIVNYPSFIPIYIERVHISLELGSWEQALESTQRLAGVSPESIDALAFLTLNDLVREPESKMATTYLSNLFQLVSKIEPNNLYPLIRLVKPFIRLCGRRADILEQCARFLEAAVKISPKNSKVVTEMAYLRLLQGQTKIARQLFENASNGDHENIRAIEGLISCQIRVGELEAAEEHLEMFSHMASSVQSVKSRMSELTYLSSQIAWFKYKDSAKRLKLLNDTAHTLLELAKGMNPSFEFYNTVNPEFLSQLLCDLSDYLQTDPRNEGDDVPSIIPVMNRLAQLYSKIQPNSCEAVYVLARLQFLAGNQLVAQTLCTTSLKLDPTFLKSHVLMAQIHIIDGHGNMAMQSLEMAMSYNFQVRNMPMYYIIKAKSMKMQGMYAEALSCLQIAKELPGVKSELIEIIGLFTPSLGERISVYLDTIDVETKLNHGDQAVQLMQEAIKLFSETREQGRIIIANADLSIDRGEIDLALQILSGVSVEHSYYIDAKMRMADIYKRYKNDLVAYAKCYSDMVDKSPTIKSWLLLGDAYMTINEPEKAIAVYERALEANPSATVLAMKIGKGLVKTHDYKKAVKYYLHAVKTSNANSLLRYDLADLYLKLGQFADAEQAMRVALDHAKSEEITVSIQDIKFLMLLGKIHRASGKYDQAIESYMQAKEILTQFVASLTNNSIIPRDSGSMENQEKRKSASAICFEMADLYSACLNQPDRAISFHSQALEYDNSSKQSMIALTKLYMKAGDVVSAQSIASNMIRMDIGVQQATLTMAEIMYQNGSYTTAIIHYRTLIEKDLQNFEALEKLIVMLKSCGMLEEAQVYFDLYQAPGGERYLNSSGYHYCHGLYFWFINNTNSALNEFNQCRRDAEWKEKAIYNMIEISLNPENETIGGDALERSQDDLKDGPSENEQSALHTAELLLRELPHSPPTLRTRVLEAYAIMATRQRPDIDRAIGILLDILNSNEEAFVPALLGTAVAHMLLKQPPKAKSQLKQIAKMTYNPAHASEFERAWLLLSDIYINGGKYDLATIHLKDVLKYNRSSTRAWEYLGFIMEKEGSFMNAAEHYEFAWRLAKESSPVLGFKLAFNYMKANRFLDAIDVSHKVLLAYPDYPKIRKEIMDKARLMIRMPV